MKILIIGGTGLISTRITQQLLARGDEVWHVNRGKRGIGFGGITFEREVPTITADRTDYAAFEQTMQRAGAWDCVMDMVGFTPADAESAIRTFKNRCEHFIFCSTVDVYAHPQPHGALPYRDDAPQFGRNQYAANKVECERILRVAHARGDLNMTIIRPAYTYAEGAGIIDTLRGRKTLIDRIRKGKPIVMHGDGQSLWCSCHAVDVARAFVNAAGNAKAFGKGYHTAGEEFVTWNQHLQIVAEAIGVQEPRLVHIPTDVLARLLPSETLADAAHWTQTNFQFNNIFDNSAAKSDLGFRYTVRWEDGARRLVRWLDENGMIANSDDDHFDDNLITAWERMCDDLQHEWTKPAAVRKREKKKPAGKAKGKNKPARTKRS